MKNFFYTIAVTISIAVLFYFLNYINFSKNLIPDSITNKHENNKSDCKNMENLKGVKSTDFDTDPNIAAFQSASKNSDFKTCSNLIDEMLKENSDEYISFMISEIKNGNTEKAQLIIDRIIACRTGKAMSLLLDTFPEIAQEDLRMHVLLCISSINDPKFADIFIEKISKTNDDDLISSLQRAIGGGSLNDESMYKIVDIYHSSEDISKKQIYADIFRHSGNPKYVPDYINLIRGDDNFNFENDPLKSAALDNLGIIGNKEAMAFLFEKLEKSPDNLYISDSISRCYNDESFSILLDYAGDTNKQKEVRLAAMRALPNYGNIQTTRKINQILENEKDGDIIKMAMDVIVRLNEHEFN